MRDGNSRVCRRSNARGDAGDDLEREPRRGERDRLLAAAAEHEAGRRPSVAPLAFHRARACTSSAVISLCSIDGAPPRLPTKIFSASLVRPIQPSSTQQRIHERVVDDAVARGEELAAAHGEETGIAGSGAHEIHHTRAHERALRDALSARAAARCGAAPPSGVAAIC